MKRMFVWLSGFLFIFMIPMTVSAEENQIKENVYDERMALYKKTEALTQVPWYYLAAIDQYERNSEYGKADALIAIQIPDNTWYGIGNGLKVNDERIINIFGGFGQSGSDDSIADQNDPEDILFSIANLLLLEGPTEEDFRIALWKYYRRDLSVQSIMNNAKIYKNLGTTELTKRSFPVDKRYNYSYRSTWGDARGFGGRRIHEGTDIFAGYGTPVLATTYGVVELKGWNLYGGWRIGIRDTNNIYHYYAHLQSYADNIKVGDIVKPGEVLGTVGATGYGPPGTSGKFPPHLHYGMYQDNGHHEWSFDPYPSLRKWEQM